MCGICGFNWDDKELIRAMNQILHHRGPDRGGTYNDKDISLGHRRLSIIDLSEAGNQPMYNEKKNILIIYNGEVYNFRELRQELEKEHHHFNSNTDTEVILHGYEQWGEKVVEKLNGMFAFCIYDIKKNKLFLARDRAGVKPLYYWSGKDDKGNKDEKENKNDKMNKDDKDDKDNKKFIFASEIKAILLAGIPRKVNLTAAIEYLQSRYIPGEETLFQGIKKLLPGHTVTFDLKKKELCFQQFWEVPLLENITQGKIKNKNITLEEAKDKIKELLTDSVKRRLIADVPVGVYLSGGIDSAAIVALASKIKEESDNKEPIRTFSVGFNSNNKANKASEHKVDELSKAKKVAEYFNTEHHEIVIEEKISPLLPKLIWHLDMPHGDPIIIPYYKLSQLASRKVKVVLSGDGADEIFAGYVQHKSFMQAQKLKLIPSIIKSKAIRFTPVKVLDRFFDYPSSMGEKGKEKVKEFFEESSNLQESYHNLITIMSKKDIQTLFNEKLFNEKLNSADNTPYQFNKAKPQIEFNPESKFKQNRKMLLNQILYYEFKNWLPNYILQINDRMTMANSIEGRTPFLDYRLVEYSAALPAKFKLRESLLRKKVNKFILREAMKKSLPAPNEKKHAFFMPLDNWFKEELKPLAEELFTSANVRERGYFNYNYLKKIWEDYEKSKLIYGKQLFTLINFELWQRIFIDSEKIPENNDLKLNHYL